MSWRTWNDTWLPADICADLDGDCDRRDHGGDDWEDHDKSDWDKDRLDLDDSGKLKPRKRKAIRIGAVTVDCTPVSFRTPGQAMNIVSCPVTEVINTPITRTRIVQQPSGIPGCVLQTPVTETVIVPVTTTVNVPPTITAAPTLVCQNPVFEV